MDSALRSFVTLFRNLWAGEQPPERFKGWEPSSRKDGRWFVLLYDALGNTYPWCYGTHFYRGNSWKMLPEREKADLVLFLKRMASVLPDSLWSDLENREPINSPLGVCCDIRLRNFSLPDFDRPEVVEFISQSVQEAKRHLLKVPEKTNGHPSRPIADYYFSPFSMGRIHIEVCWYLTPKFIRWPEPDILRRVPDAHELKQKLDSLARATIEFAPEPSLLDKLQLPPKPAERRRPSFDRLLDASTTHEEFAKLEALIEPAHDFVLAVYQTWLDKIKGQAFPLYDDNKRLASVITDCASRYGIRLFFESKGELVEAKVYSRPATTSQQSNPEGAAALAGNFSIHSYDPTTKRSGPISTVATFPQLIAARSVEHARSILDARKSKPPE